MNDYFYLSDSAWYSCFIRPKISKFPLRLNARRPLPQTVPSRQNTQAVRGDCDTTPAEPPRRLHYILPVSTNINTMIRMTPITPTPPWPKP